MANVFPLFGSASWRNLGLDPGSSLLAGISVLMTHIYFVSFQILVPLVFLLTWRSC